MKQTDFKTIMDSISIPSTYYSFPEKEVPVPPYFVWYFSGSDNFSADNTVYAQIEIPVIELYSKRRSITSEQAIETVLNNSGFFWNKSINYVESEQLFQIIYELGEIKFDGEQN